jgi:lysophospholipid acyltransferase (LPLAT)-like uncharacterized protein
MKIRSRLLMGLGGLLGTGLVRWWMDTLHCRIVYHDPALDPGSPHCHGQKIYIFWHEYILLPLYLRGHCNLAMLLSRHQDAEVLSHIARHMGFAYVRGSTNRGGVTALRELLRKSRKMHLTITPDGPRGPRRQMSTGPIYLASKLQIPLVFLGFGYERPWRVRKAWDQFAIPRPYSRATVVVPQEMYIPPDLSRDEMEQYRCQTEVALNRANEEAEAWAESGVRKSGQMTLIAGPHQPRLGRIDPAHGNAPPGACVPSRSAIDVPAASER